jgi:hypothetical protein
MVVSDNIRARSWEKNYGKCLFLSAVTHCRATVRVPPHKNETSFRQRNCNNSKQINTLGGCLSAAVLLTSINLVCFFTVKLCNCYINLTFWIKHDRQIEGIHFPANMWSHRCTKRAIYIRQTRVITPCKVIDAATSEEDRRPSSVLPWIFQTFSNLKSNCTDYCVSLQGGLGAFRLSSTNNILKPPIPQLKTHS